jgi:signal transduction histidine kinase
LDFRGRTLEQEQGDGWTGGVHLQDVKACIQTFFDAFDSHAPFTMEYRFRRHDGQFRWIASHGVPQFDSAGTFLGYVGSCIDITDRVTAEQEARDLSERLINAQDGERARVARELHDDVSQRLARLALDLGRLNPGRPRAEVDAVVMGVREEIMRLNEDVHALSYNLHPSVLVDLGLDAALKGECDRIARRGAIAVSLKLRELPGAVSRDVALGLFRVAQEALRNAVEHGRSESIHVTLRGVDDGLQLAVRDDGVGFDASRHRHPSLGLASMRARMRLLNGELDVESAPGEGTMVVAWVPLLGGER